MKKSDNFLSDFLFLYYMGGLGRLGGLRRLGRYEQQARVGGVVVALNYS